MAKAGGKICPNSGQGNGMPDKKGGKGGMMIDNPPKKNGGGKK